MELIHPVMTSDKTEYRWYFILLVNISFTILWVFTAKNGYMPFTHYYIPDAVYYEDHVFKSMDRGIANGFTNINSILYSIGPQALTLYNTLLMLGSVYLCSLFAIISPKAVSWARAIVIFNPYLLISVLGPSKECNLTFFSLLSIYFFVKKKWSLKILGLAPAIILIFIRPQFGAILLLAFLLTPLLSLFKNTMLLCTLVLVSYFALNAIPAINTLIAEAQGGDELPFFKSSSIYELAVILQLMSTHPLLQIPAFIAKLCLVMFTPIARPNSITASYFPLLDWAYTFMANVLFPLNFGFLMFFFNPSMVKRPFINQRLQFIIIYAFAGVLSVIISPNIQFRYLFPYAPFLAACFTLHSVKMRNNIFRISFFFMITCFIVTAIFLPKEWELDNTVPFFLSWL